MENGLCLNVGAHGPWVSSSSGSPQVDSVDRAFSLSFALFLLPLLVSQYTTLPSMPAIFSILDIQPHSIQADSSVMYQRRSEVYFRR